MNRSFIEPALTHLLILLLGVTVLICVKEWEMFFGRVRARAVAKNVDHGRKECGSIREVHAHALYRIS